MTRVSIAISLLVLSLAGRARADGPYEGDWRSGPMRIDVTVESWGGDCGPRPQSTTVPGGATIHVTQSGDDLTFAGRPPRSTRGCWSENASVRRVSSTYQSGTWRITCRTPEEDPRAETGQYTLHAVSGERIEFRDVSRYDWALNESHCRATLTSTQSFDRVGGAAEPVAQPEPVPTRPEEPACTPGAPARLALRPAEAAIEPGGRQCFVARVVDASGCAVPGHTPQLELRAPAGATGTLRGACFQAASNAAEAEGEFTIVAHEGAFDVQARVRVRTADLSDLIAGRIEGGGAVTSSPGEATSEEAARVAARGESARGSLVVPIIGAVIGLVLVLGATLGLLARGRRRKRAPSSDSAFDDAPASDAVRADAMPAEGARADVARPAEPVAALAGAAGPPKICPLCRRGHPPDATRCANDGTALVPYADFVAGKSAGATLGTKVCPVCGARFPATTRFCGKDGTTLVDG